MSHTRAKKKSKLSNKITFFCTQRWYWQSWDIPPGEFSEFSTSLKHPWPDSNTMHIKRKNVGKQMSAGLSGQSAPRRPPPAPRPHGSHTGHTPPNQRSPRAKEWQLCKFRKRSSQAGVHETTSQITERERALEKAALHVCSDFTTNLRNAPLKRHLPAIYI